MSLDPGAITTVWPGLLSAGGGWGGDLDGGPRGTEVARRRGMDLGDWMAEVKMLTRTSLTNEIGQTVPSIKVLC